MPRKRDLRKGDRHIKPRRRPQRTIPRVRTEGEKIRRQTVNLARQLGIEDPTSYKQEILQQLVEETIAAIRASRPALPQPTMAQVVFQPPQEDT